MCVLCRKVHAHMTLEVVEWNCSCFGKKLTINFSSLHLCIRMDLSRYGESDEYSFVFRKETTLFNRRTNKIL